MDDNELEEKILQELKMLSIKLSIKKRPRHSLKECLSLYEREQLMEIAYKHGIFIGISEKMSNIVDLLVKAITNHIVIDIMYMDIADREMFSDMIMDKKIEEHGFNQNLTLQRLGYIFVFYYKKTLITICPEEVKEKIRASYHEMNQEIIVRNNQIFKYEKALKEIYGVYEISQLMLVWNQYNEIKINRKEAIEHMIVMDRIQQEYWWDEPYIVADYMEDEDEYQDMLEEASIYSYYTPTIEEINYYSENEFDEDSVYYKRLLNYFVKKNELDEVEIDDLILDIEIACTMNVPTKEIMEGIIEVKGAVNDLNEANYLAKLVLDLSNNTRKWALKGNTPTEIKQVESKTITKTYTDNVIQFPGGH